MNKPRLTAAEPWNSESREDDRLDRCAICASPSRGWRTKTNEHGDYALDVCTSCGFGFVNPRPALQFLIDFYSSFGIGHAEGADRGAIMESVLAQEALEPNSTLDASRIVGRIQALIGEPSKTRLLDVGCGYGFFSKEALDAGFHVEALELAEHERGIAHAMTGIVPAACAFEDFDARPGSFGAVLMSQILEHALDVNAWMDKARLLLSPDGVIAIAVPNFGSVSRLILQENEPYITPPEHLNFFTPLSLRRLLEKHGFRVEGMQHVSRLPRRAFERRLPQPVRWLAPAVASFGTTAMSVVDALGRGIMITAYGRKMT